MLFWAVLLAAFIAAVALPNVVITDAYRQDILPLAGILAVYAGSAFLVPAFINVRRPGTTSRTTKILRKQPVRRQLILIFTGLMAGCITFVGLPSITATYLHQNAPKENVEIETVVSSAWPHKSFRADCHYSIMVDFPENALLPQSVCIDNQQWAYFSAVAMPVRVTLYGEKSYFGYELHCCKQNNP